MFYGTIASMNSVQVAVSILSWKVPSGISLRSNILNMQTQDEAVLPEAVSFYCRSVNVSTGFEPVTFQTKDLCSNPFTTGPLSFSWAYVVFSNFVKVITS